MTDLTLERRAKMRRAVTECAIPMGSTMWPVGGPTFSVGGPTLLALLDAADERDRLVEAVEAVAKVEPLEVPDWDTGEPWSVYDAEEIRQALGSSVTILALDGPTDED